MRFKTLNGEKGLLTAVIASAIQDIKSARTTPQQKQDAVDWFTGIAAPLPYQHVIECLGLPSDIQPKGITL